MKTERYPREYGKKPGGGPLSLLLKILGTAILVLAAAVTLMIVVPQLKGYREAKAENEAMAPEIPGGSLVIYEKVIPEKVPEQAVIACLKEEKTEFRRVLENHLAREIFTVKADGYRGAEEETVLYEAYQGQVKWSIPLVGNLLFIYGSPIGRLYAAGFALLGLLSVLVGVSMKKRRQAVWLAGLKDSRQDGKEKENRMV